MSVVSSARLCKRCCVYTDVPRVTLTRVGVHQRNLTSPHQFECYRYERRRSNVPQTSYDAARLELSQTTLSEYVSTYEKKHTVATHVCCFEELRNYFWTNHGWRTEATVAWVGWKGKSLESSLRQLSAFELYIFTFCRILRKHRKPLKLKDQKSKWAWIFFLIIHFNCYKINYFAGASAQLWSASYSRFPRRSCPNCSLKRRQSYDPTLCWLTKTWTRTLWLLFYWIKTGY